MKTLYFGNMVFCHQKLILIVFFVKCTYFLNQYGLSKIFFFLIVEDGKYPKKNTMLEKLCLVYFSSLIFLFCLVLYQQFNQQHRLQITKPVI